MRAAVMRGGEMIVREDAPEPRPGPGQVLIAVKACGICGSDLHFLRHGATMLELAARMGGVPDLGRPATDLARDVYMGHEFAGEILEAGPDTDAPRPGTLVTSVPVLVGPSGIAPIVYSNDVPGGYGERMLLTAPLLLPVPDGVGASRAALTEPMAVGLHAVNKAALDQVPGAGALVLGCGPVGQAVIAALGLRRVEPIVAADFSAARRDLARRMGAHHVVDPAVESSFEAWAEHGGLRPLVVFEAVGVPGMIDDVLQWAPPQTRLVVVGVCMGADAITPFFAIAKEINVQFALAYDPLEFAESLRAIAEGNIDVEPLITGTVGLDGVAGAFAELADPDRHCKILVEPQD